MNPYLVIILGVLIGAYFLDVIVDFLNVRHLKTDLPREFEGEYDRGRYGKAQRYLKETIRFSMLSDSIVTPITIAFILWGGFNMADQFARGFGLGPIPTGLIFMAILLLASQLIHLPFSIYETFVIEEKYGFNTTSPQTFVLDIVKGWALAVLLGGGILAAVLWLFQKAGPWAWLYCWGALVLFQLIIVFIAPILIMPLFNKFVPLEEGPLREAIEDYAASQDFKIRGIFTMNGSKRSTRSNAFFTGLGRTKRIVLYDTLIEKHTVDELVSVLAHEMGHYKKRHILKSLGMSVLTTGLMFYILSLFINNRELFDAFRMEETSIYASLLFFAFLYIPVEMMVSIADNMLSRKHEYEADVFCIKTHKKPDSMIRALKKLSVDNLSNLTPHPLKVFLSYSHPPVIERIRVIQRRSRKGLSPQ